MQRGSDLSWWRYDERGRVTRAYHDGAGQSSTRGVGWAYDSADRLTSLTYPTGEVVSYTYDAAWRQSSLCSSYGGCYVTTASYTALDQPYDRTFANGHTQNQRHDETGLYCYQARLYHASLGLFLSPDRIVPGTAAGAGGGAATLGYDARMALAPLTVSFAEPALLAGLNAEHAFTQARGFWFQLSAGAKSQAKVGWGPLNPQALNRYAYVLNNPMRYTDPTGHNAFAAVPYPGAKAACMVVEFASRGVIAALAAIASGFAAIMVWYAATTGWKATIDADKQGKHIPGHRNFIPGRSELTHPDPQALLDKGMGTGVKHGHKEVVDFGDIIGYWVDRATGEKHETTRGTIHYDSTGRAHIVPARPLTSGDDSDDDGGGED